MVLVHPLNIVLAWLCVLYAVKAFDKVPEFRIKQDRFLLDGRPMQLISGSMHYFRIHPEYWHDRLTRGTALGLNAIEVYVPWNLHEPFPGQYTWEGFADLEQFISIAQELGLLVILRPGPYICAEWDFGGLPWWLASSQVSGGGTMRLRTSDPAYLSHVDRWWGVLFARVRPLLHRHGGPIVMVQIENEYGFCGSDKAYLRHLLQTAQQHLGKEVLFFTTDPPGQADAGTLPGDEIYTVVDFGPGWSNPDWAFATQARLNAKGKSPPFCSEFYTGWLSHWGEPLANTSARALVEATWKLLQYANGTASLSFYMAHGGTNFGFWGGANLDGGRYQPHITSYDYDCPISEAGDYCQPGIGGGCKFHALREAIVQHTGRRLPPIPPPPRMEAYGTVPMRHSARLLDSLAALYGREGIRTDAPNTMEEYGQRWGLILYRTRLPPDSLTPASLLDLGAPVHDFASAQVAHASNQEYTHFLHPRMLVGGSRTFPGQAGGCTVQVFADGELLGSADRSSGSHVIKLTSRPGAGVRCVEGEEGQAVVFDILVHAMGRSNFGCNEGGWDRKGLTSPTVKLNGALLRGWEVFPLQLDSLAAIPFSKVAAVGSASGGSFSVASSRRLLTLAGRLWGAGAGVIGGGADGRLLGGVQASLWSPTFYRGEMHVARTKAEAGGSGGGHPLDTYLSMRGWGKGLAWVNGFNLGWYWPSQGPQITLYVPGPVLRQGSNEVILLELERQTPSGTVASVPGPDFQGP